MNGLTCNIINLRLRRVLIRKNVHTTGNSILQVSKTDRFLAILLPRLLKVLLQDVLLERRQLVADGLLAIFDIVG